MASASRDPSVGALLRHNATIIIIILRHNSTIIIIILDAVPGVDWTDPGTTSIEVAAIPNIHPPDVEFRFRQDQSLASCRAVRLVVCQT